jgi:lipopolysaccharide transport system permease protein
MPAPSFQRNNSNFSKPVTALQYYLMEVLKDDKWDWEISSRNTWQGGQLAELWRYRNLLARLVRRDFLLNYQQTLLGPLWILLQPALTLIVFVIIFGKFIGISTGSVNPVLFYLSAIILWTFFSESFTGTSFFFTQHAELFSKVYFPRLIVPLSIIAAHLLRFFVQMILLFLVVAFYIIVLREPVPLNKWMIAIPFILFAVALIALSGGLLFSVLTARYRDLGNVVHLGIRLLMFATPVIYPLALLPESAKWIAGLNPLSPLFEAFRYSLFGEGSFTYQQLLYAGGFAAVLFSISFYLFNKQSEKLMDVV